MTEAGHGSRLTGAGPRGLSPGLLAGALPALVLVVVALLQPASLRDRPSLVLLVLLAVQAAVVLVGVIAYVSWHLDRRPGLAWASFGLLTVGTYGAAAAVLRLAESGTATPPSTTAMLLDLVVVAAAVAGAAAAGSRDVPRDPLAVALVTAIAASVVRAVAPDDLLPGAVTVAAPVLGSAAVALAAAGGLLMLRVDLPDGLRGGTAGVLVLGAATAGGVGALVSVPPVAGMSFGVGCLGLVAAVAVDAGRRLRTLTETRQRDLRSLGLRATRAEAAAERHRDRMHELRATVAGVASAAEVLADRGTSIAPARRAALHELLVNETERLRRLTHSFGDGRIEPVALDPVLGRVVSKQRALGQIVRWEPSGLVVEADADMLQEVFDILLVNAQSHAPGSGVRVSVRSRHDSVVVRVRDTGPGVPPEIRDHLFQRGVRGPVSAGSGIGLHLARRLAQGMGGTVTLEPTQTGTCFVLTFVRHGEEASHDFYPASQYPDARSAC